MVVNIRVPFWVLIIILHLIFRVPNFDNHPYESYYLGVRGPGVLNQVPTLFGTAWGLGEFGFRGL